MKIGIVGCIFYDQATPVTSQFLKENNLTYGTTTATTDIDEHSRVWANAIQSKQNDIIQTPGGSETNFANVLAHLGGHTITFIAKIGTDSKTEETTQALEKIGISCRLSRASIPTGIANSYLVNGERTIHTYLGSCMEFCADDVPDDAFDDDIDHVHFTSYSLHTQGVADKCLNLALNKPEVTLSFDLASQSIVANPSFTQTIQKIHERANIIFGNEEEFKAFTNTLSMESAFASSLVKKEKIYVITAGKDGCYIKDKGSDHMSYIPHAPVVGVVDTTGAGDTFSAGILDSISRGLPLNEAVVRAHKIAQHVITQIGAHIPDEKWPDILRRLI